MKSKKVLQYVFLGACILLFFSCGVSEIVKKKYRPGFYIAHKGEKKTPTVLPKDEKKNTFQKENKEPDITVSIKKPDSITPQFFLNPEQTNITASSITKKKSDFKTVSREIKRSLYPQHFFQSFPQDPPASSPKVIWQFKVAIICLSICLLGIICIFGYSLLPALHFLVYVAGIFPETWLAGILFSIIGFFKYRKNPENIPAEPKELNFFSRLSFILGIIELIDVPLIIIATALAIFSFTPLIVLTVLMLVMSATGFISGMIGLIKTLKDPKQSRKNIVKAILISLFSPVPFFLMLAWFIAVGTAIVAAAPYLAAALFILH